MDHKRFNERHISDNAIEDFIMTDAMNDSKNGNVSDKDMHQENIRDSIVGIQREDNVAQNGGDVSIPPYVNITFAGR